jgi:Prokaryotic phospholipase A2
MTCTAACQRHDFGYRNFKAQNRFTAANKLRIDDKFRGE